MSEDMQDTSHRQEKNNLTESDDMIEDMVKSTDKKKKPLIIIGGNSQIRCHRCGTSKNYEDKGVFQQINNFVAWFHNKECGAFWNRDHPAGTFKTGAILDEHGKEV